MGGSRLNCFWKSARTEGNSGDPDPHMQFTKIQPNTNKKNHIQANLINPTNYKQKSRETEGNIGDTDPYLVI